MTIVFDKNLFAHRASDISTYRLFWELHDQPGPIAGYLNGGNRCYSIADREWEGGIQDILKGLSLAHSLRLSQSIMLVTRFRCCCCCWWCWWCWLILDVVDVWYPLRLSIFTTLHNQCWYLYIPHFCTRHILGTGFSFIIAHHFHYFTAIMQLKNTAQIPKLIERLITRGRFSRHLMN